MREQVFCSSRENQIVPADKEKKKSFLEKARVVYADSRFCFLNHLCNDNYW